MKSPVIRLLFLVSVFLSVGGAASLAKGAPVINSMFPNPVPTSSQDQAVSVFGSGFVNGTGLKVRVKFPGGQTDLQGTQVHFASSTQLTILIKVGTTPASWTAQVINPNGEGSNVFSFQVVAPPQITGISPSSYPASGNNQTMTIDGGATSRVALPSPLIHRIGFVIPCASGFNGGLHGQCGVPNRNRCDANSCLVTIL